MAQPPLLEKAPSGLIGEPSSQSQLAMQSLDGREVPWRQPWISLPRRSDITHCRATGNGLPLTIAWA